MLEASIPKNMRWIPREMTVLYEKIAKTDLLAVCEISLNELNKPGEFPMEILVTNKNGDAVFKAVITMHISLKKKR